MRSTYQFYASLLDAYQNYLDAESRWESFYGGSDNPSISIDEYLDKSEQELIDKLNRVPFDSEAADKGTAFNEIVDYFAGTSPLREGITFTKSDDCVLVNFNGRDFVYDLKMVEEFAYSCANAIPQYHCVGQIATKYGYVTLYGYIDELFGDEIHDIKTTSRYSAFKFRNNWQHIVYPFCVRYEGVDVSTFRYDIVLWGKTPADWKYYSEHYNYSEERDKQKMILHIEGLIEFITAHRDLIKDKKLFNDLEGQDELFNKYGE